MTSNEVTRPSLLIRIRDSKDSLAWNDFVEIYAPLVHGYLRKRGVQDADAADLTQDVLHTVSKQIGKFRYDTQRGSFRGWLLTITLNRLRDFVEKKRRQVSGSGKTEIHQVLMDVPQRDGEDSWNRQHEERLFTWAAERAKADFRPNTWMAFWQTAVEQKSAKEVAKNLDISVGAVHIAKSRALARIREIICEIES